MLPPSMSGGFRGFAPLTPAYLILHYQSTLAFRISYYIVTLLS